MNAKKIWTREVWKKEQTQCESKQMNSIRTAVGKGKKNGVIFVCRTDGLIIMKHDENDVGKIVVPESLRAYVLKMFHNAQLGAHQGKNRTLKQITGSFYWLSMKADITKWEESKTQKSKMQ